MNRPFIAIDPDPNSPHRAILDRIPYGQDNAVSMRDLARALGETQRQIRHRIERARIDGNIIAGTNAGLFIPQTGDELREYVKRTQARIETSASTVAHAVRVLEDFCDEQ